LPTSLHTNNICSDCRLVFRSALVLSFCSVSALTSSLLSIHDSLIVRANFPHFRRERSKSVVSYIQEAYIYFSIGLHRRNSREILCYIPPATAAYLLMSFERRPPPLPYSRSRSRFGPKNAKASVLFGLAAQLLFCFCTIDQITKYICAHSCMSQ
jgi:hypothetical protein